MNNILSFSFVIQLSTMDTKLTRTKPLLYPWINEKRRSLNLSRLWIT